MKDLLLEKMFLENDRWTEAIKKANDKGICKTQLQELCDPSVRAKLYLQIKNGEYHIEPPRTAQIPKDNGEFRTVYICSDIDRIFLNLVNKLLFDLCPDMVHKSCKSYQHGIGCGKVVKEVVRTVLSEPTVEVGYKTDLSKYFDTPRIELIDEVFDKVEQRVGKSVIIDIVREFYHDNRFYTDGVLHEEYKSIKQGTATSSFLADALLYDVDKEISEMNTYYVRYSDDCLILGNDWRRAFEVLSERLKSKGLGLNPNKVEVLRKDRFFKFLGFSIRGNKISISKGRLERFKKEIQKRTVKKYLFSQNYTAALNAVHRYLYKGEYSWASSVLPILNIEEDIDKMNAFVMDMLRAVKTGRYNKKFGIGYEPDKKVKGQGLRPGVVTYHPIGSAGTNRNEVETLEGYMSLGRMRKALLTSKEAYDTLVRCI